MTKISNAGSDIWILLKQPSVSKSEDRKQIRDVVPELKERQINEKFGGQKAPELSLPEGYEAKLTGTLKKAAAFYEEQNKNGNYVNATKQALKYLNEDAAFSAMHQFIICLVC